MLGADSKSLTGSVFPPRPATPHFFQTGGNHREPKRSSPRGSPLVQGGLLLPANDAQLLIVGLIASHGEQLRRFLRARARNVSDVPDMLQEVYLRMLRVSNVESVRCPEAYLFTVAQHVVQQHMLKSAAMPSIELEKVLGTHAHSMHGDPALELIATQSLDRLQESLDELSPKAQAVFLLSRRDGLSFDEIAVQLGVSIPMVKKYLMRALVKFRERLKQAE
jgi:RNA polymerase sigma factor (sigma-70 family)